MKQTILVTGGLGYIGSHTVVELLNEGFDVVIIDNLSNSEAFIFEQIKKITSATPIFYKADLCDPDSVFTIIAKHKPELIVHFAAFKSVEDSVQNPLKYFKNNLESIMNLLKAMDANDVKKFVLSSSATVYGIPSELPAVEETPWQRSLSAYGSTKQMAEEIVEKLSTSKKIKAISLRYFNPVGAHPSGLIGEQPKGAPNNLFPYLMKAAGGKLSKLTVFGDDYDTPDGSCVRDYIHVVDLAKAHILACNRLLFGRTRHDHEIFNLGTGKGISVLEVIRVFKEVTGVDVLFSIGPRRKGDVPCIYADVSKSLTVLGWKAELGLQDMIQSSWLWECNLQSV